MDGPERTHSHFTSVSSSVRTRGPGPPAPAVGTWFNPLSMGRARPMLALQTSGYTRSRNGNRIKLLGQWRATSTQDSCRRPQLPTRIEIRQPVAPSSQMGHVPTAVSPRLCSGQDPERLWNVSGTCPAARPRSPGHTRSESPGAGARRIYMQ